MEMTGNMAMRMVLRTFVLFGLVFSVAPLFAQAIESVTLEPGMSATIMRSPQGDGTVLLVESGPAERSRFADAAAGQLADGTYPDAVGPNAAIVDTRDSGLPDPAPVPTGRVRFTFTTALDGDQRVLLVENGFSQEFYYRATITRNGQSMTTDVCSILPELRGVEHWPFVIDSIELSDFAWADHVEGRPVTCR